jgi:hypothetical protein
VLSARRGFATRLLALHNGFLGKRRAHLFVAIQFMRPECAADGFGAFLLGVSVNLRPSAARRSMFGVFTFAAP